MHKLSKFIKEVLYRKLNCGEHFSSEVCSKANSAIILSWMGKLVPEKTLLCFFMQLCNPCWTELLFNCMFVYKSI